MGGSENVHKPAYVIFEWSLTEMFVSKINNYLTNRRFIIDALEKPRLNIEGQGKRL